MAKAHRRTRIVALTAALVGLAPAWAGAQEGTATAALPAASDVVARYVEAIGGRSALLDPPNTRTRGHFEMPAAGLRGEMEVLTGRPNLSATSITIPGLGSIRSGFDGTTGWSVDPMMGARILSGAELAAMRDQSDILATVRDASLFDAMETVERTEMAGQPCYMVRFAWKSGRESLECFHTESGLLVGSTTRQESPMGTVEVTMSYEDYKQFGPLRMPTRMVQQMMGQQQVLTISDVEFGVVEPDAFTPPAEIQAMTQ